MIFQVPLAAAKKEQIINLHGNKSTPTVKYQIEAVVLNLTAPLLLYQQTSSSHHKTEMYILFWYIPR